MFGHSSPNTRDSAPPPRVLVPNATIAVIQTPQSTHYAYNAHFRFQNLRGMRLEHTGRVAWHHRVPQAGHDRGEGTSPVPRFSFRRAACGGRADCSALSGDVISFPAVAPCDCGGPASACQIMTIQNRRNRPKKLIDLESDDCRWPLGEPRSPHFRFCAAHQLPGYPYCERHCRIAFHAAKPRIRPPLAVPSRPAKAA